MKKMIILFLLLLFAGVLYGQNWNYNDVQYWGANSDTLCVIVDSGVYNFPPGKPIKLVKKEIIDGKLGLTFSQQYYVLSSFEIKTKYWKEIYIAQDGEIVLWKKLLGKYRQKKVMQEFMEQELYYEEEE